MKVLRYDDVITLDHIKDAYQVIRKNTEHRDKLFRFELFYFTNLYSIEMILRNRTYHHGEYNLFLIREPKYRLIMSEGLSDKIVNHLVSKYVLQPIIFPMLISSNVATRKGKGSKAAIDYFKHYVNQLKNKGDNVYVLKCDISKYFYNIDHEILMGMVRKFPMDKELYDLVCDIVSSTDDVRINDIITKKVECEKLNVQDKYLKEELERIPMYHKGKGLPIGNMSSQIFALLYLNGLDHFIKENLGIKHYIRYMDDFLLFSTDREYLKVCWKEIEIYLQKELKLQLNRKTQIRNLKDGVNFLGYRYVLKDKKLYIFPTSRNRSKILRKLRQLQKQSSDKYEATKVSYKGYFMISNLHYYERFLEKLEIKE